MLAHRSGPRIGIDAVEAKDVLRLKRPDNRHRCAFQSRFAAAARMLAVVVLATAPGVA